MDLPTYLDFDLLIERVGDEFRARVLESPGGQGVRNFQLPFDERDLEMFGLRILGMGARVRRIDDPGMKEIREFGRALFDAVFEDEVLTCLDRSLFEAERQQSNLRLRLRIDDDPMPGGISLSGIPWEFLFDRRSGGSFLAASELSTLVRFPTVAKPIEPLSLTPPLRLLTVISSPTRVAPLDTEAEWQRLNEALEALKAQGRVVVERIEPATSEALQRQFRRGGPYHVFHFIGHGDFDERRDEGVLLFETSEGKPDPVSGEELRALLGREPSLRLAILNACEGARTSKEDPFAGVAQSLVQSGMPAVIAMQMPVTDQTAIALSREFYGSLADGYPVDAALAEARTAIRLRVSAVEWGVPVLYMRSRDGLLFSVEPAGLEASDAATVPESAGLSSKWTVADAPREAQERLGDEVVKRTQVETTEPIPMGSAEPVGSSEGWVADYLERAAARLAGEGLECLRDVRFEGYVFPLVAKGTNYRIGVGGDFYVAFCRLDTVTHESLTRLSGDCRRYFKALGPVRTNWNDSVFIAAALVRHVDDETASAIASRKPSSFLNKFEFPIVIEAGRDEPLFFKGTSVMGMAMFPIARAFVKRNLRPS